MKLEIKEPCDEDWNKMKLNKNLVDSYQIGLNSRHCEVCVKSVVDFTEMNRAEIIAYILSNKGDQVCGRLRRDQFDFRHEDIPILIETLSTKPFTNAFLIIALVCISLSTSAQEQNTGNISTPPPIHQEKTKGRMIARPGMIAPIDTTKCETPPNPPTPKDILSGKPVLRVEDTYDGGIDVIQENNPQIKEVGVHQFSEKMPEFCGGIEKLFSFVQENIRYPKKEMELGIAGNVYVRFIVNADGTLRDAEIIRSIDNSENLKSEVLRLISIMPDWEPGEHNGKKVAVYMTIPIRFQLK